MARSFFAKSVARRQALWWCVAFITLLLPWVAISIITKSPTLSGRFDLIIWCMALLAVPMIVSLVGTSIAARRLRRMTKDDLERCASCGYSAQGLEVGPKGFVECPECGGRVKSF